MTQQFSQNIKDSGDPGIYPRRVTGADLVRAPTDGFQDSVPQ